MHNREQLTMVNLARFGSKVGKVNLFYLFLVGIKKRARVTERPCIYRLYYYMYLLRNTAVPARVRRPITR